MGLFRLAPIICTAVFIPAALAAEPLRDAVRHALTTNPTVAAATADAAASTYELLELQGEHAEAISAVRVREPGMDAVYEHLVGVGP